MDIVKLVSPSAQAVVPTTPTTLVTTTVLISEGGSSMAPSGGSVQVIKAGYYLVTLEVFVVGTGQQKIHLRRGSGFEGPLTESIELSGNANGVSIGRTLMIKVSAGSFLFLQAVNGAGANRDYTASLCVARLAGA